MLHWKIRLALLAVSLSAVAAVGGAAVKGLGFYW